MSALTKAQRTRRRIIEKSAAIFNEKGYAGTSMSDILEVTGLTKGGIYGNFSGKEELALEVFEYNRDRLFGAIQQQVTGKKSRLEELHAFFRGHGHAMRQFPGGCPILNTAIEADDTHPELKKRARAAILIWMNYLKGVIGAGIGAKEIDESVDAERYARMFISMLEGGVFMGKLFDSPEPYLEVNRRIRKMIDLELAAGEGE